MPHRIVFRFSLGEDLSNHKNQSAHSKRTSVSEDLGARRKEVGHGHPNLQELQVLRDLANPADGLVLSSPPRPPSASPPGLGGRARMRSRALRLLGGTGAGTIVR